MSATEELSLGNVGRPVNQIFLLSPARCDGERGRVLLNPKATFALAELLRTVEGVPLADAFTFLSGLYFRGKIAYARVFARRARRGPAIFVITTDRGLMLPDARVTRRDLLRFAKTDIADAGGRYLRPLRRDVDALAGALPRTARIILLGSIATGKYVDVLLDAFGERLLFPSDFVGRGDMSRGALLLRCARDQRELAYTPVAGAVRRGRRAPRIAEMNLVTAGNNTPEEEP